MRTTFQKAAVLFLAVSSMTVFATNANAAQGPSPVVVTNTPLNVTANTALPVSVQGTLPVTVSSTLVAFQGTVSAPTRVDVSNCTRMRVYAYEPDIALVTLTIANDELTLAGNPAFGTDVALPVILGTLTSGIETGAVTDIFDLPGNSVLLTPSAPSGFQPMRVQIFCSR